MAVEQFTLPNLHALCPFEDATNPNDVAVGAESSSWVNSYKVFSDAKRAEFMAEGNEFLTSHCYPYASYERLRGCCDFINTLFVVDEISDVQNGDGALSTGMIYLNVLKDPTWDDGSKLAKLSRDFRERLHKHAKPNCQRRFYNTCAGYVDAVGREAKFRSKGQVLNFAAYEKLRRRNGAVYACFAIMEYALDIDLPDKVVDHPTFQKLQDWGCDLVCWPNDIYSYDIERSKGLEGNNILTVLMQENGYTLQQAADRAGELFGDLMKRFMEERKKLPSWGPEIDRDANKYLDGIGCWIIGNIHWCLETPRYFGDALDEVNRTGIVKLRPIQLDTGSNDIFLYENGLTKETFSSRLSNISVQASMPYLVMATLVLAYIYHLPGSTPA